MVPDTRRGIGVNTTRDESDLSFHHSRQQYKGLGNGVATLATSATFSLWWKSWPSFYDKSMMVENINKNNRHICAGEKKK